MQYVKGSPYFCKSFENLNQYKYLNKDISTDILIVGAGICGCILNYYLSKKHDVILIDKGRIGQGCTSCATAILEYQLDDFYEDLQNEISKDEIIEIYKMGQNSIKKLEKFVKKHGNDCQFYKRPSFSYTTKQSNYQSFKKEFDLRKNNGFNCHFITKDNNPFPFNIECGIYDSKGGAEINPYLFTKRLIENSKNQDAIFENTEFISMQSIDNKIYVQTSYGYTITCNKIIFATGFNLEYIKDIKTIERFITYTIITSPQINFEWYNRATIHDDNDPYHYLRLLPDNRIIFGGEDIPFKDKNFSSKKAEQNYEKLYNSLLELFTEQKNNLNIDYKFCGCFGSTSNNLGLIGETKIDNVYAFYSCGANGIVNALYGVDLIEDIFNHKENKLTHLFCPIR